MPIAPLPFLDRTVPTFRADVDKFFLTDLPGWSAQLAGMEANINAKEASAAQSAQAAGQAASMAADSAAAADGSRGQAADHAVTALAYAQAAQAAVGLPPPAPGAVLIGQSGGGVQWGAANIRPNLLPNGGFELGSVGWVAPGWSIVNSDNWGPICVRFDVTGTVVLISDRFSVVAGVTYTVTGDSALHNATAGSVYFDLNFYDGAGVLLLDSLQNPVSAIHDFAENGQWRTEHAVAVTSPAGAVYGEVRFIAQDIVGPATVGCRQVKVERGGLPATAYSMEATLAIQAATSLAKQGGVATNLAHSYLDHGTVAAGGTLVLDANVAAVHRVQAGGALTLTLANVPAGVSGEIELIAVNFGGKTVTWPAGSWVKPDGSHAAAVGNSGVTWQTAGVDRVLVMWDSGSITYKVMR